MLQVITESLKNKEDQTKITLLFGNMSPDDILLKDDLDKLAKEHADR
jgi:cytochrome-b5 reductase